FLLVLFFFPTVVNGPIEAPRRFAEGWSGEHGQARRDDLLAGLARVAVGVGKLWLVGVALRPGWMSEAAGLRAAPAYALWSRGILLYVWFYLGFFPPNAWGGFFVWGALNALGVLAVGPVERMLPATTPWAVAVRRFGTFLFASLCWVPFFMPPELPFNAGLEMLLRMLLPFR